MITKFVRRIMDIFDDIIVRVWINDSEVCFQLTDGCVYGWTVDHFHEYNKAKRIWTVLSRFDRVTRRDAR